MLIQRKNRCWKSDFSINNILTFIANHFENSLFYVCVLIISSSHLFNYLVLSEVLVFSLLSVCLSCKLTQKFKNKICDLSSLLLHSIAKNLKKYLKFSQKPTLFHLIFANSQHIISHIHMNHYFFASLLLCFWRHSININF